MSIGGRGSFCAQGGPRGQRGPAPGPLGAGVCAAQLRRRTCRGGHEERSRSQQVQLPFTLGGTENLSILAVNAFWLLTVPSPCFSRCRRLGGPRGTRRLRRKRSCSHEPSNPGVTIFGHRRRRRSSSDSFGANIMMQSFKTIENSETLSGPGE